MFKPTKSKEEIEKIYATILNNAFEVEAILKLANSGPSAGRFPKSGYKGISRSTCPKHAAKPWRVYYKSKDRGFYHTLEEAKAGFAAAYKADPPRPKRREPSMKTLIDKGEIAPLTAERENALPKKPQLVLKRANPLLDVTHPEFGKLVEGFRAKRRRQDRAPIESKYAGVSWSPRKSQWKVKYGNKVIGYAATEVKAAEMYAHYRDAVLKAKLPPSGYRGVSWHAKSRQWVACRQGKYLGYFADAFEAHLAYEEAGELSWTQRRLSYDKEELARQELARVVALNEANITKEAEVTDE